MSRVYSHLRPAPVLPDLGELLELEDRRNERGDVDGFTGLPDHIRRLPFRPRVIPTSPPQGDDLAANETAAGAARGTGPDDRPRSVVRGYLSSVPVPTRRPSTTNAPTGSSGEGAQPTTTREVAMSSTENHTHLDGAA